jgi:iron complex outermembrane receptor protein
LTLTTLNGHSVSSGDWFADNIVGGGRSVSFSLFPSELIGRVTVYKGARADLLEGGSMGVVDIGTRKPLDFKKSFNAQAGIGAVYTENSEETDPQVSGMVAWKNASSTFGILGQAFYQKRSLSRAGQENQIWWDRVEPGSPIANAVPGAEGAYTSYYSGAAWFEQVRTRKGGLIDFQIKPSSDFSADLTIFHSKLDAPNINHNSLVGLGRFFAPSWAGNNAYPAANITGSVANGVVNQLAITVPANCGALCASSNGIVQENFSRPEAYSQSQFVNLDTSFRVNDKLTLATKLGATKGIGHTKSGALGVGSLFEGGSYQINGIEDPVSFQVPGATTFTPAPGTPFGNPYTYGSIVRAVDKEVYGQVDGTLRTDLAGISALKFGVRVANHKRTLAMTGNQFKAAANPADPAPGSLIENLPTNSLIGMPGLFNDVGAAGAGWWTFSQAGVNAWLEQYVEYTQPLRQNEFSIKEPTASTYLMAEFGGEGFSGNVGTRIVHTSSEVTRYNPATLLVNDLVKNNYLDVLPSANVKFDLTKDLVARVGVSRTMSRPELGMMAGLDLRDQQLFGNVGNADLKPIRSNNFDVNLEWYFAPKSIMSAGLFASSLDGYVTYGAGQGTFYNQLQKKDTVYQTSQPINTTAEVRGLELFYQQDLAGGFGVQANYTYTYGKETGQLAGTSCGNLTAPDCTLIGTSKNAYNLGAYFENDRISARVTYSWRSAFLNGTSRNSAARQNDIANVNASLAYKISDNFSISLDGKDLNNPTVSSRSVFPGAAPLPAALYKNGAQYYLTLQMKM